MGKQVVSTKKSTPCFSFGTYQSADRLPEGKESLGPGSYNLSRSQSIGQQFNSKQKSTPSFSFGKYSSTGRLDIPSPLDSLGIRIQSPQQLSMLLSRTKKRPKSATRVRPTSLFSDKSISASTPSLWKPRANTPNTTLSSPLHSSHVYTPDGSPRSTHTITPKFSSKPQNKQNQEIAKLEKSVVDTFEQNADESQIQHNENETCQNETSQKETTQNPTPAENVEKKQESDNSHHNSALSIGEVETMSQESKKQDKTNTIANRELQDKIVIKDLKEEKELTTGGQAKQITSEDSTENQSIEQSVKEQFKSDVDPNQKPVQYLNSAQFNETQEYSDNFDELMGGDFDEDLEL